MKKLRIFFKNISENFIKISFGQLIQNINTYCNVSILWLYSISWFNKMQHRWRRNSIISYILIPHYPRTFRLFGDNDFLTVFDSKFANECFTFWITFCASSMFLQHRFFFRTIIRRLDVEIHIFLGGDVCDFALFDIFEHFCDFLNAKQCLPTHVSRYLFTNNY